MRKKQINGWKLGLKTKLVGTGHIASLESVTNPEKIKGKDFVVPLVVGENLITSIADRNGFSSFSNLGIQSVKFPEHGHFESIGGRSFENNEIEELVIPKGVKRIYQNAFKGNKIKKLILPEGLEYIGEKAFANNEIQYIDIPDTVKHMGEGVFKENNIKDFSWTSSLDKIPKNTFMRNNIRSLNIPQNIKEVGERAFAFNPTEKLNLPDGLKYIYAGGFSDHKIKKLIIPESVREVDYSAFGQSSLGDKEEYSLTLNSSTRATLLLGSEMWLKKSFTAGLGELIINGEMSPDERFFEGFGKVFVDKLYINTPTINEEAIESLFDNVEPHKVYTNKKNDLLTSKGEGRGIKVEVLTEDDLTNFIEVRSLFG